MKNQYTPYLFEKYLSDKELTLQKFFNLEDIPKDINKSFRDLRMDIKSAKYISKDIIKYCDRDELTNVSENVDSLQNDIDSVESHIEVIEKSNTEWEYAYESLENLLLEIINKENIDLSRYSTNMTESESTSYKRIKIIGKLLNE